MMSGVVIHFTTKTVYSYSELAHYAVRPKYCLANNSISSSLIVIQKTILMCSSPPDWSNHNLAITSACNSAVNELHMSAPKYNGLPSSLHMIPPEEKNKLWFKSSSFFRTAKAPTHNRLGILSSGGSIQINENPLDFIILNFDTGVEGCSSHRLKGAAFRQPLPPPKPFRVMEQTDILIAFFNIPSQIFLHNCFFFGKTA